MMAPRKRATELDHRGGREINDVNNKRTAIAVHGKILRRSLCGSGGLNGLTTTMNTEQ